MLNSSEDYIIDGEAKLNEGKFEEAIVLFNKALKSDLGPIGSSVCYWNIFIAYDKLNKPDDAAESIMSFRNTILLFQDQLSERRKDHPGFVLMKKLKIGDKIKYSNVILDIYWMKKALYNCRTITFACEIPDIKYIAIYNDKLPFCINSKLNNVYVNSLSPNVEINVSCKNNTTEKYYFKTQ